MMNKAGLYFHIPFCLRKCAYCDFCSFTGKTEEDMRRYTRALLSEMEAYASIANNTIFDTVFFGGGTPSLLPVDAVSMLLDRASCLFHLDKAAEITLEANPATADIHKLSELRRVGINRLSIGVQSLSDPELMMLGRLHDSRSALAFFKDARRAGFDNINLDLMYGIPAQTPESAEKTLSEVLLLHPEHISAYSLMLEEGTPLFGKKDTLPFPDEDTETEIELRMQERLKEHGYRHYEISNYAKPGHESCHNLHYWHSDAYLGFGVAAYSFWNNVRYGNGNDLDAYLSAPTNAVCEREVLNTDSLAYEFIMLRFRLAEGVSLSEYKTRFGEDLKEKHAESIRRYTEMGLMTECEGRVSLTERGFRVSNAILVDFMSDG